MSPARTLDRFSRPAERRGALDRAHLGDIRGAAGTIGALDTAPRRGRRRQLAALLAIAGPGLIVMAADNDAGSVSVFAQTGRSFGPQLLWVLVALAPVLYVGQEMAARLGAVTGAGHARLIRERFGRHWCAFSLADLALLNVALLVTEFIGVSVALSVLGVSRPLAVPLAAVALIACTMSGSFPRWERLMAVFVAAELIVIALAVLHHPSPHVIAAGLVPGGGRAGGGSIALVLLALVGTSICPWQIFLQQSTVVDKRITPRWLGYERLDIAIGTALFIVVAAAVMVVCATLSGGSHHLILAGPGAIAARLGDRAGSAAAAGFAVALLSASLLGAAAVSLSTSYAVSEVFGWRHSLHRRAGEARTFHGLYAVQVALAAGVVLIPHLALGTVTTLVQALAGLLLPSALGLLLMLANDAELLGPHVNSRWQNAVAGVALIAVLGLSTVLALAASAPRLGIVPALAIAAGLLGACGALIGFAVWRDGDRRTARARWATAAPFERSTWTTPGLERIGPAPGARSRRLILGLLRGYTLVLSGLLLGHVGLLAAGG